MTQTDKPAIMVVDDAEANRYTLGRYLTRAGFEVWPARTGREALDLAANGPALTLLDVKLPDLSGFEVCRRLKSHPATAHMPVLLTSSALKSSRDRVEGLGAGADGFLTAPVEPDELLAHVKLWLRLLRKEVELQEAHRQLQDYAGGLEASVTERTRELARANAELQAEIARREAAERSRANILRQLVTVQEAERRRVARELHDELGQHLTALSLGLRALKDAAPDRANLDHFVHPLQELTNQMGQEVHRLALELRPTALDDIGLLTTLRNYVNAWSHRTQVEADFQSNDYDGRGVPPEIETTLYRTVQEALNNVAKHAHATQVSVLLARTCDQACVIIEDNGCGFDADQPLRCGPVGGLGLLGMRERLALLGGSLNLESSPGSGTTVFARVPLSNGYELTKNSHSAG